MSTTAAVQPSSSARAGDRPTRTGSARQDADLFPASEERIGITANEIRLCLHAPINLLALFDMEQEDLSTYWYALNDRGGIHGRKIVEFYENDDRQSERVADAAEACRSRGAFLLRSGPTFETTAAGRAWAERTRMPYLHHIAPLDLAKRYSFSHYASQETLGRGFAEVALSFPQRNRLGVVWRQSDAWMPGYRAFIDAVRRRGVVPIADLPVIRNQGIYSQQIAELKARDVKVVWLWESSIETVAFIRQARAQDYRPQWVIWPGNFMLEAFTGDEALNPPIAGVSFGRAYALPEQRDKSFDAYAADLEAFEDAVARYRPGSITRKNGDLLFDAWQSNRRLAALLGACGPDCTRDRLANLMLRGEVPPTPDSCAYDFRLNGRVGEMAVTMLETCQSPNGVAWRERAPCREGR